MKTLEQVANMPYRDIQERDNEILSKLSESKLPIIVYGAGQTAQKVVEILNSLQLCFEFAVDREYLPSGGGVITPEQADSKYLQYHLLISYQAAFDSECGQFKNAVSREFLVQSVYMASPHLERVAPSYIVDNLTLFNETYEILSDEFSKRLLIAFLQSKVTLDFDITKPLITRPAYFVDDIFKLPKNAVFVDCGAYDGDTLSDLIKYYPDYGSVHAFEPSPQNAKKLRNFIKDNNLHNCTVYEMGCSDKKDQLRFSEDKSQTRINDNGTLTVYVDAIDKVLQSAENISMIKMDIEGAELAALKGAVNTIKRDKPVLAICVYHKQEDLITIPQFIESILPNTYNYYLRIPELMFDLVLYAVPK